MAQVNKPPTGWHLYMIRTRDGCLYTGITKDVERRLQEHLAQGTRCAKYLRGKSPLTLVYSLYVGSYSDALKAEAQHKRLSKQQKETLIHAQAPHA